MSEFWLSSGPGLAPFSPGQGSVINSQGVENGTRLVNVYITDSRELEKEKCLGKGALSMAANILISGCFLQSHIPACAGLLQGMNIYCSGL